MKELQWNIFHMKVPRMKVGWKITLINTKRLNFLRLNFSRLKTVFQSRLSSDSCNPISHFIRLRCLKGDISHNIFEIVELAKYVEIPSLKINKANISKYISQLLPHSELQTYKGNSFFDQLIFIRSLNLLRQFFSGSAQPWNVSPPFLSWLWLLLQCRVIVL